MLYMDPSTLDVESFERFPDYGFGRKNRVTHLERAATK
jgi:hypothetical protein